jgi:hypothetical protein
MINDDPDRKLVLFVRLDIISKALRALPREAFLNWLLILFFPVAVA